jgi:HlyD family secretion protein
MKRQRALVIFFAVLLLAAMIYYFLTTNQPRGMMIDGIVDANQVIVSPKVQGLLERLSIDEGTSVRAGQLIATLDTAELTAEKDADRASVENLRAQLAQSESNYQVALDETAGDLTGAEARLAAAKSQLALSQAQLQRNQTDFGRIKALATQGVSAQQDLDHTTADLRSQQAMVAAQEEQVRAAEGDLKHAQAGEYRRSAAKSAIESTKAQLRNAESELDAATARLSYTDVVAPISGVVSVLVARQGELVGPSAPIATIVDPQSTWIRVGIPETFAANIAVGEKIRVQLPSGRTVYGTVLCKSVEGDFASQYDLNQTTRDIRSVSIKIAVPNPDLAITPGMSAKVILTPEQLEPGATIPTGIPSRQAT